MGAVAWLSIPCRGTHQRLAPGRGNQVHLIWPTYIALTPTLISQLPWLCHLRHIGGQAAGSASTDHVACLLIAWACASPPRPLIQARCTMVHHGPLMPLYPYIALQARNHRLGYAYCYSQCVVPPPARTSTTPHQDTGYAHYPRVPLIALTAANAPVAVLLATCAEVKWLGYVHARRHCPSSLLVGPGDAPVYAL